MILASVAFLGSLYLVSLYYQDGRGLSALASGLSIFPEALGIMGGAQLASRVLYPRLGPSRGSISIRAGRHRHLHRPARAHVGQQTSLWWSPAMLMVTLGLSIAQVFVPDQAASFATISPAATGRASTMFNAMRQLGGAIGVAVLTTAIVLVGPVREVAGHPVANLTAYHVAFLAAAAICLSAVACSLSIRDADAAATIPGRRGSALARRGLPSPPPRPEQTMMGRMRNWSRDWGVGGR